MDEGVLSEVELAWKAKRLNAWSYCEALSRNPLAVARRLEPKKRRAKS